MKLTADIKKDIFKEHAGSGNEHWSGGSSDRSVHTQDLALDRAFEGEQEGLLSGTEFGEVGWKAQSAFELRSQERHFPLP